MSRFPWEQSASMSIVCARGRKEMPWGRRQADRYTRSSLWCEETKRFCGLTRHLMEGSQWTVVLRSRTQPLVIHNRETGQVRALRTIERRDDVSNSVNYFRLLWEMGSRPALPPSLSSFVTNGYFEKFFTNRRLIGRGGSGSVYHVDHVLAGLHLAEYAVKIVPVGEFTWLRKAVSEVQLLERLSAEPHPLILGYRHCWIEDYQTAFIGPKIPCLFILMEYAKLGNLENFLKANGDLSDKQKWFIFLSIAVALRHLHTHGILHRDLKLSNILLFPDADNRLIPYRFVLSDFGTSVDITNSAKPWQRSGATGTIETMAPELIEKSENGMFINRHSFSSDVWSLGVILFTLFFGVSPFAGPSGEERLAGYTNFDDLLAVLDIDSSMVDQLVINMIRRMMQRRSADRITLDDFFNHPEIAKKLNEFKMERFQPRRDSFAYQHPSQEDLARMIALPIEYKPTRRQQIQTLLFEHKYQVLVMLAALSGRFTSLTDWAIHTLLCCVITLLSLRYKDALYLLTITLFGEFLFTDAISLPLLLLTAALVLVATKQ